MKFVTLSTARNTLPSLIANSDRTVITRNGQPAAVLLDFEEFRAMRADLLLARNQAQHEAVLDTLRAVRAGNIEGFPEVLEEPPAAAEADTTDSAGGQAR